MRNSQDFTKKTGKITKLFSYNTNTWTDSLESFWGEGVIKGNSVRVLQKKFLKTRSVEVKLFHKYERLVGIVVSLSNCNSIDRNSLQILLGNFSEWIWF